MKSVSGLRAIALLCVLFVPASPVFVLGGFASDVEDAAVLAVGEAEDSMGLAYEAVFGAEEAGANVSRLLAQLNVAGEYLDKANICLMLGDFDKAIENSDLCGEVAAKTEADAVELKKLVPQEMRQRLLLSMMSSIIAICVIGAGGAISWHVFKGRYNQRISGRKPEVDRHGA